MATAVNIQRSIRLSRIWLLPLLQPHLLGNVNQHQTFLESPLSECNFQKTINPRQRCIELFDEETNMVIELIQRTSGGTEHYRSVGVRERTPSKIVLIGNSTIISELFYWPEIICIFFWANTYKLIVLPGRVWAF